MTDATAVPADDSTNLDPSTLADDTAADEIVTNDAVAGETVLGDDDEPVEEPDDDAVMAADAEPSADALGVDGEAEPTLAENELAGQDIDLDDTPPH